MKKNIYKCLGSKKNIVIWITLIFILSVFTPVTISQNIKIIDIDEEYNVDYSPSDNDAFWWNTDWNFRKEITIDHTKVNASCVNFPVLISFSSDSNLANNAQDDGDDIAFTDYGSNQLNHEIEYFDSSIGELVSWVNIPSLSSTEDTIIYLYYGNPDCDNQENPTGVWDSNFVMVQHLEETDSINYDSTSYGNDGTPEGGVDQYGVGKIDGADMFDGIDDNINCGNDSSLSISSMLSVEAWVNFTETGSELWQGIVSKNDYFDWAFAVGGTQAPGNAVIYISGISGDDSGDVISTSTINDGLWHHIIATCNGYTTRLYVDGIEEANSTTLNGVIHISESNLIIGDYEVRPRNFNGSIDEVRVSNVVRNADWIKTGYNNQFDPATFYSVGVEETVNIEPVADFVYTPVNPSTEDIIQFNDASTDSDGFIVSWFWDFGDGDTSTLQNPTHQYADAGTYDIYLLVTDDDGYTDDITKSIVVEEPPNQPPSAPEITGETNGNAGTSYDYSIVAIDPDNDNIAEYIVNWGDGNEETFTGPFASGVACIKSHTWTEKGTYTIKAKAKDINNAESDWGTLTVTMPKNKAINKSFLYFLQQHIHLFSLFKLIMRL